MASWVAWGYIAVATPLAHVLYDRLDMGLLLLLLIWIYGRIRSFEEGPLSGWNILSYVALGVSIPYKLIGIVAVPFVVLADLRGRSPIRAKLLRGFVLAGTCLLVAAIPFVVQWNSSGSATLSFFKYHSARGIEIESTYGSALMLLSLLGLPLETEVSFGSANLVTPVSQFLAAASPLV